MNSCKNKKTNTIKKLTTLALVASSLSLISCATVINGTSQNVRVKVIDTKTNKPIPGAVCQFTSDKGNIFTTDKNPGSFHIGKSQGDLQTHCVAKGYKQKDLGVTQDFDAWVIADILLWPTIFIDLADSAYHKYPQYVIVTMDPVKK